MQQTTYTDKLTDIRRVVAQFERLPPDTQRYVVGYVEGAASVMDRPFDSSKPPAERPGA